MPHPPLAACPTLFTCRSWRTCWTSSFLPALRRCLALWWSPGWRWPGQGSALHWHAPSLGRHQCQWSGEVTPTGAHRHYLHTLSLLCWYEVSQFLCGAKMAHRSMAFATALSLPCPPTVAREQLRHPGLPRLCPLSPATSLATQSLKVVQAAAHCSMSSRQDMHTNCARHGSMFKMLCFLP